MHFFVRKMISSRYLGENRFQKRFNHLFFPLHRLLPTYRFMFAIYLLLLHFSPNSFFSSYKTTSEKILIQFKAVALGSFQE